MATNLSNTTFAETYNDDYRDSDNYHRILFNGGKTLQSRELTQSQTLINKQLERVGSNLFKEGGTVTGGNITVDNKVEFIKLTSNQFPSDASTLVGKYYKIASPNPQLIVKILGTLPYVDAANPQTLIVEYVDTTAGTSGATSVRVGASQKLQRINNYKDKTLVADAANFPDMITSAAPVSGRGTQAHITAGSFFVQGHFVFAKAQSIFVSRYGNQPNEDIGFQISEQIVTTADDTSLFDNSGASPNLASPGADRYRIQLTLTTRTDAASNNFIYLGRVSKGILSDEIKSNNSYNLINNLLALRTKEESGNYTVKPFDMTVSSVDSNINYNVTSGTSYIDGHRVSLSAKTIATPVPDTTQQVEGDITSANYGNYILGYGNSQGAAAPYDSAGIKNIGLPDIQTFKKLNLYRNINTAGPVIGTCRCRAIYRDYTTGHHKFYLFDIRMKDGEDFGTARSFGLGPTDRVNIVTEGTGAVLKGNSQNNLLFKLPHSRPVFDGIAGQSLIVQKRFEITTAGATSLTGTAAGGLPAGVDRFYGTGANWVVSKVDGTIVNANIANVGTTFDISGLSTSTTYDVLAQVQMSGSTSVAERNKELKETTITKTWPGQRDSDGRGNYFIGLDRADCFAIKHIKLWDSNGVDVSDNFTFDNGQRDNYYGLGRLIPKTNVTIPNANIHTRFQYFDHDATVTGIGGQVAYFSVTSYKGNDPKAGGSVTGNLDGVGVSWKTIPDYIMSDGTKINLRDYLDFRPVAALQHCNDSAPGTTNVIKANGYYNITFDSAYHGGGGGLSKIHLLPPPGGTHVGDNTYYLPRRDKLAVTSGNSLGGKDNLGKLLYIEGVPSFNPEFPVVPDDALPLYDINLRANTVDKNDFTSTPYSNKRFTMKDISRLENRIENLEELTTLSLLELDTSNLNVVDSAGNPRTKAGFLVDNFADYSFTDVNSPEQRATIDHVSGILSPEQIPMSNRLLFSSGGATTAVLKGDYAVLPMSSDAVEFMNQNLASTTENINPFAVITSNGHIEMSPASDTWVETKWAEDHITQGQTEQVRGGSRAVNDLSRWQNNWIGQPSNFANIGASWREKEGIGEPSWILQRQQRSVTVKGRITTREEHIGDRIKNISIIPFMRSIKVYFRAQGLRRNTKHYPYFANNDISNYTKNDSVGAFQRFSTRTDDAGNLYTGSTAHPDGSSQLQSDSQGQLAGSFIIPSNEQLKINTGGQIFKLLDITGGVDSDSISVASAMFTSTGTIETKQRLIRSTRIEELVTLTEERIVRTRVDPLAQSFLVNEIENPNGIFLTKVRIYFATKEDDYGMPVICQIRAMDGGVPTDAPLPGAIKMLRPSEITATPMAGTNIATVRSAGTDFIFDEPVYLPPNQEYAVVLLAESTAYEVYISKTYDFVVGTTAQRINRQPTLGSLFLSQNQSTWTPAQEKDLMFTLYRAEFQTSGAAILNNAKPANSLLGSNPIQTKSTNTGSIHAGYLAGDSDVKIYHPRHGFSVNDNVTLSGVVGPIATVAAASFNQTHKITQVDHEGFIFKTDSAARGTDGAVRGGGSAVITSNNILYNSFVPQIQTLEMEGTSVTGEAKFTSGFSYAGVGGADEMRVTDGHASNIKSYTLDGSYSDIVLNQFNYTETPKIILSELNGDSASISNSLIVKLNMTTTDTKVSPIVDLQRSNWLCFENIIDRQDSATAPSLGGPSMVSKTDIHPFNKPTTFVAETHPTDGTAAAKHVTRITNLQESAVGLKILFGGNRPDEAEFKVYYRVGTADEDLNSKTWHYISEETDNPPDNDVEVYRQYEYLPGGQVGNLDAFTKFQVKIVMTSVNSSKIPSIKDLRVIAMVT